MVRPCDAPSRDVWPSRSFNSINQPRCSVTDLDSDRRPDLVLTIACNPMTYARDLSVGQSRWITH